MEHTETINQWENGLHIRHIAHSLAFSYYNSADKTVGLSSTLLTALVSSAIFASISKPSTDGFIKTSSINVIVVAGVVSIIATLFSAANAFLKYGELAARHNQAVASFGSLRRELETTLMNTVVPLTPEKMEDFNAKWTKLEETVPAIPQRIFNKASRQVHRIRERA
jgi:hypothetical protein